jgi:hypothetical protein
MGRSGAPKSHELCSLRRNGISEAFPPPGRGTFRMPVCLTRGASYGNSVRCSALAAAAAAGCWLLAAGCCMLLQQQRR